VIPTGAARLYSSRRCVARRAAQWMNPSSTSDPRLKMASSKAVASHRTPKRLEIRPPRNPPYLPILNDAPAQILPRGLQHGAAQIAAGNIHARERLEHPQKRKDRPVDSRQA